jgi:hypothetical protein
LAARFFAAVSFAGFLPAIGISISFWPRATLRGFLADFFGALASDAAPPTLRLSLYSRRRGIAGSDRLAGLQPVCLAIEGRVLAELGRSRIQNRPLQ